MLVKVGSSLHHPSGKNECYYRHLAASLEDILNVTTDGVEPQERQSAQTKRHKLCMAKVKLTNGA